MIGIPISGLSCINGDNMSVVLNTSRPESVLRKKSNMVCMQSKSCNGRVPGWINTQQENVVNLMTKVLYRQKKKYLISNILYDIKDDH